MLSLLLFFRENYSSIMWMSFHIVVNIFWFRFVFIFKKPGTDERLWWLSMFSALVFFDSVAPLTFFVLGTIMTLIFYKAFSALRDSLLTHYAGLPIGQK